MHRSGQRCGCCDVTLSASVTAALRERYDDCLCVDCLKRLEREWRGAVAASAGDPGAGG